MSSFGNQGAGFYAGTNWGNPYGGRYYSPSGVATGSTGLKGGTSPLDSVAELAYASQSGGDTIGSYGGDGPSAGSGGRAQGAGPAMGALTSMGVGYLVGQMGLPSYVGGPLSSLAGKAVSKGEITEHDLATVSLATIAKAAAPALFANPAVALGLGVAGLFGFNPFSSLIDQAAWAAGRPEAMSEGARNAFMGNWLGLNLTENPFSNINPTGQANTAYPGNETPGYDKSDLGGGITTSAKGEGVSIGGMSGNRGASVGLDFSGSFPGYEGKSQDVVDTGFQDTLGGPLGEVSGPPSEGSASPDGGFGFSDGQADSVW